MGVPSQSEVLEYAKKIQAASSKPISKKEMERILEAKFLHGKDYFSSGFAVGAVNNPVDWASGLASIVMGVVSWLEGDEEKAVKDVIKGVTRILF